MKKNLHPNNHIPDDNSAEEITRGTNRRAESIDVQVINGVRNKILHLIRKVPINPEKFSEHTVEQELQVHQNLQRDGIPCFTTFRRDQNNPKNVYCTDLTQNGKNYVFSKNDAKNLKDKMPPPTNSDQLLKEIIHLAKMCADKGYKLHRSAFFFQVDKQSHKAFVLVGDYKSVEIMHNQQNWEAVDQCKQRFSENLAAAERSLKNTGALLRLSEKQYETAFHNAIVQYSASP